MFVVTEADAAAIRAIFERDGELSAAIEVRRTHEGAGRSGWPQSGTILAADPGREPPIPDTMAAVVADHIGQSAVCYRGANPELIYLNAHGQGFLSTIKVLHQDRQMTQRPEHAPGEAAPATGTYEQRNIFGTIRVNLAHGQSMPSAPLGQKWTRAEEERPSAEGSDVVTVHDASSPEPGVFRVSQIRSPSALGDSGTLSMCYNPRMLEDVTSFSRGLGVNSCSVLLLPVAFAGCRQRYTGSSFEAAMGFPTASVNMQGELKTFNHTGDSSQPIRRRFCGDRRA